MVHPGDRFMQVFPLGSATLEVESRVDDEHVAVRRASGARQVFPIATLLNQRYWVPADAVEAGYSEIIARVAPDDRMQLLCGSARAVYQYALSRGWITEADYETARAQYGCRMWDYTGD